jgi:hypothetical protein
VAQFITPEDALDFFKNLLDDNKGELGLGYVAYGDEDMSPMYPAVKVTAGPFGREVHGTHKFLNHFVVNIWVYHAKMVSGHAARSKEDLELATSIRQLIHSDLTCSGGVIFGHVAFEEPTLINRSKGAMVVGTQMSWNGQQVETF